MEWEKPYVEKCVDELQITSAPCPSVILRCFLQPKQWPLSTPQLKIDKRFEFGVPDLWPQNSEECDVLEIGFGCGYSASRIQRFQPRSHTIIECRLFGDAVCPQGLTV